MAIGIAVGLLFAGVIRVVGDADDVGFTDAARAETSSVSTSPVSATPTVEVSEVPPAQTEITSTVPTITSALLVTPGPTAQVISAADALQQLAEIPVVVEHRGDYNRDLFAVWSDVDGNGCDAREDVLAQEAMTTTARHGCITEGTWYSVYDAQVLSSDSEVEVDHVVALKEAWESGAWEWAVELRINFANDTADGRTLVAVSIKSNNSKRDDDPANWLPSDPAAVCAYLVDWVAIKYRWHLSMDPVEWERVRRELANNCA